MVSSQKTLSVTKAAVLREVPRKRIVAEADLSPKDAKVRETDPKEDLFDKSALLDKMMADQELAEEIMNTFYQDVQHRVAVIKKALGNKDASKVSYQAKTIKSASNNFGAADLQAVAYQIEVAADSGELCKAGSLIQKISEYLEMLKKHWRSQDLNKTISFYDNFDSRR